MMPPTCQACIISANRASRPSLAGSLLCYSRRPLTPSITAAHGELRECRLVLPSESCDPVSISYVEDWSSEEDLRAQMRSELSQG